MCIMNIHIHGGAYVFSGFPCYLGVFPYYMFNKEYLFYLESLPF